MMRDIAVATMGRTPAVATQFIKYLRDSRGLKFNEFILISTSEPFVYGGSKLVKYVLEDIYDDLYIEVLKTDVSDLTSLDDVEKYVNNVLKRLREYVFGSRDLSTIHFCIAGGRKNMAILSTIFSLIMRPTILYHIINLKVDIQDQPYKDFEDMIISLGSSTDRNSDRLIYNEIRRFRDRKDRSILDILFPPISDYRVVEIYVPPYPRHYIDILRHIVSSEDGVKLEDLKSYSSRIDEYISPLANSNLIEFTRDGSIKPSKYLIKIREFFMD